MIVQCHPRLRLDTPLGPGMALFYEDDGEEIWWTVGLRSRAIVQFPNHRVKLAACYTDGAGTDDASMLALIEASNKIARPMKKVLTSKKARNKVANADAPGSRRGRR